MSGGVFAVDRGVFDHPVFAPAPFTETQAWIWMLSAAAWKDTRVRVGTTIYELKRGEMVFATRFLAERWKWNHSRVVRFLKKLKSETMVSTLATRDATHITICNYEEYQFGGNANETQNETPTGTEVKRQRNKEEEDNKYKKEEIRKEDTRAAALGDWPTDYREQFWLMWPNKVGKPAAMAKLDAVRKSGATWAQLTAGLERYIRSKPPDRAWLNPATFLHQRRFEDEPAEIIPFRLKSGVDMDDICPPSIYRNVL